MRPHCPAKCLSFLVLSFFFFFFLSLLVFFKAGFLCLAAQEAPGILPAVSSAPPCFFNQCLSLALSSPSRLCWLACELQGSTCLCVFSTEITIESQHTWLSRDRSEIQVLLVHAKHFTDRAFSPALEIYFLMERVVET